MKNKLLVLSASLLVAQGLYAKDITCYKKDWAKPSTIESTPLQGDICEGKFSLKQMKQQGWFIKDIQIKPSKNGLDYSYVLTDINPVSVTPTQVANNIKSKAQVSFDSNNIILNNVTGDKATIAIGNLKAGQSGIIQHKYDNGKTLIVSAAFVENSTATSSTIKFIPFMGLKQNAIPTSSRKPQDGDRFVLNYLYNESLLIAPNAESFRAVRKKFTQNNFVHSDVFGAYLKAHYEPTPSKDLIQEYALSQNMGTIFVVLDSFVYVVDAQTFIILSKKPLSYIPGDEQMPLYTRVQNIEKSILDFDWFSFDFLKAIFGDDERTEDERLYGDLATDVSKGSKTNYTAYYKEMLGLLDD